MAIAASEARWGGWMGRLSRYKVGGNGDVLLESREVTVDSR